MTGRQTRAERAAYPLARDSIRKIAEASGGRLLPVQLRRTDTATGETVSVMVPCGVTLASICPPCAERAKALRAAQCREGWDCGPERVRSDRALSDPVVVRLGGQPEAGAPRLAARRG
jgi:hypothetical protein